MRVTTGNNPYAHQQQRTNNKDKGGFADMLANMAANKSGKTEASGDGGRRTRPDNNDFLHGTNPHRCHDTENKLRMGQLTLAKTPNTAELVECKAPDPTYPASINDLSHDELKEALFNAEVACSYLNTEGLSKGEIYNQIESIFQNFLGKDFKEPFLLTAGIKNMEQGSLEHTRNLVFQHFGVQLTNAGVSADPANLIEARGYTGMSESEMRAAVREKYPENMSLKDCILMGTELWELGLEETNYGTVIKHHIMHTTGIDPAQFTDKVQELYNALLDMPADLDAIKTAYANYEKGDRFMYPTNNMDGVFERLLSWFGGSELASSELLGKLRAMLDDMEKSGELVFDQFGYCRSPEKV